jgi:hypothetical protein
VLVGLHRPGGLPPLVGGSAADRHSAWLYVEGNGQQGPGPASLYEAQVELRR